MLKRMLNRRLFIQYSILVGLPLIGVVAVLEAGRGIVPPTAIGGSWRLELDGNIVPQGGCDDFLNGLPQPAFAISQSGRYLGIVFNDEVKTRVSGILQGNKLSFGQPVAPQAKQDEGCGLHLLNFEAIVDGPVGNRTMQGRFSLTSCPSCAALPFRAYRETQLAEPGQGKR